MPSLNTSNPLVSRGRAPSSHRKLTRMCLAYNIYLPPVDMAARCASPTALPALMFDGSDVISTLKSAVIDCISEAMSRDWIVASYAGRRFHKSDEIAVFFKCLQKNVYRPLMK